MEKEMQAGNQFIDETRIDIDEFIEKVKFIKDERGIIHGIVELVSSGGQGVIFKTEDPNVLLKLRVKANVFGEKKIICDEKSYKRFKEDINEIRLLQLPENLPIAMPAVVVEGNYCGYLMEVLDEMCTLKNLAKMESDDIEEEYRETGGLKKRVFLFMKIAQIFIKLQSSGVVYSDLSLENIFISSNPLKNEVWLVDSDNMKLERKIKSSIFTPGTGAPEVVNGLQNTLYSDRFTFALLLYYTLTTNHPFEGKLVVENENNFDEEAAWEGGEDMYEKAHHYQISWVGDEDDKSNRSDRGIPPQYVVTEGLQRLFQQTFGFHGINSPSARPDFLQWYNELKEAYDKVVECDNCGQSYYINEDGVCPFCNDNDYSRRERVYRAEIKDRIVMDNSDFWEIAEKNRAAKDFGITDTRVIYDDIGIKYFSNIIEDQYLLGYHIAPCKNMDDELKEAVQLSFTDGAVFIKNLQEKPIKVNEVEIGYYESINIPLNTEYEDDGEILFTLSIEVSENITREIRVSGGEID